VVEVAKELVETVVCGQVFIAVAKVVLPELPGVVTHAFEHFGNRNITILDSEFGTGQTDLGEAGAQTGLSSNERRAAGGTALVTVVVGKPDALFGDTVNIGRAIAHDAIGVSTDIGDANIVAPDHKDVGLIFCEGGRGDDGKRGQHCG